MGRLKAALLVPIFMLAIATGALADPIINTGGGGSWQAWTAPTEGGGRFWDNLSWDGHGMNVGYYILDPVFGGGNLEYWGTSTGGFHNSFYLQSETGTQRSIYFGGTTAYQGIDEFGWFEYTPGGPGQPGVIGDSHTLFGGALGSTPGTTSTFTPTSFYGYYLTSGMGETFTTVGNGGQFALFDGLNGALWIGVEDLPIDGVSDGDYNDMIMRSTPVPVPEPSSLLLLGTGLVGLGAAVRRRLRR